MPPELAWWASTVQLSGLRADQADRARQFLTRAAQLDPALRDQIGYRIAGEVVAHISPPPPPGAPPDRVLAAVLAERHRRELARLQPGMVAPHPATVVPQRVPMPPPTDAGGFTPPS
jgi:hypothetical protein